jgi:splicing factor 3A subunit 2
MSFLDAREHGSKPGAGFLSMSQENVERRERLRRLALETIDLDKDPYFMKNHIGKYECRLCLTLHTNEGSYLAHTQGKRHQQNMARRAARETREKSILPDLAPKVSSKKGVSIGRPGYRVTKQFDTSTCQRSLLFQIDYSEIEEGCKPRQRFMSTYEQRKESADRRFQYILFHAKPYEVIAFKVPNYEVDKYDPFEGPYIKQGISSTLRYNENRIFAYWDSDSKLYTLQIYFKTLQEKTQQSSLESVMISLLI